MQERIEKIVAEWVPDEGDFVPSVIGEKLHAQLLETSPSLLEDWLRERAPALLTAEVAAYLARERGKANRRAVARSFGRASKKAENGEPEELGHFTVTHVVDKNNTRRRVADMTGADHSYVADHYQQSGKYDLMLSAFHRAIGKTLGKRTTADLMSEQQYDEHLQSFAKRLAS